MVVYMNLKVMQEKRGKRERKSETAMAQRNKTLKYSVDATCQNVSCLLL